MVMSTLKGEVRRTRARNRFDALVETVSTFSNVCFVEWLDMIDVENSRLLLIQFLLPLEIGCARAQRIIVLTWNIM